MGGKEGSRNDQFFRPDVFQHQGGTQASWFPLLDQSCSSSLCSLLCKLDKMSESQEFHHRLDFDWSLKKNSGNEWKAIVSVKPHVYQLDLCNLPSGLQMDLSRVTQFPPAEG